MESSPSFLAPAMSFCSRSAPAYCATSAAVVLGLTCAMAAAGKTATAAHSPAIRGNFRFMASVPVPLDLLSFEEELGPKFLPFFGLVERDRGIDHLEWKLVELRVDHA